MRQQPFTFPEEALEHFGIKGMRWGIRKDKTPLKSFVKDEIVTTTKNGDELRLTPGPHPKFTKFMAQYSKRYRKDAESFAVLAIKDKSGERIGTMQIHRKSKDELNVIWIDTEKSARGKGYAQAAMKSAESIARDKGFKRMTLEVPGNSPDARHIYEKQGFKVTKEPKSTKDIWGGLTEMEKKLN